jgi:ribosomal protein S18 acetylase RimI-like enzyme
MGAGAGEAGDAATGMGFTRLRTIGRALHDFRRDAAITWDYGGPAEIWRAFLDRTIHRLYRRRRGILFEEDLTAVREDGPPPGVEIRVLADRDWEPVARAVTTRALDRFRRNTMPGNTCLVAWRGERPVGFTWLSEPRPTLALPAPLPSDAVYGWGLWVDPRERRRGVGSALVRARLVYTRKRGFRRAWRIILEDNRPAFRTIERSSGGDARVLGTVLYVTFLGRMRIRYEPGVARD